MDPETRCCKVDNMCGYSLKRGVVYVGIASFVISSLALLTSLICLGWLTTDQPQYSLEPMLAINTLMALYCISVSMYQLVVSMMLLWQSVWTQGSAFICSTWYVSHLCILTFYTLLFFARIAICIATKHYVSAFFTIVATVLYDGTFIYFSVVVYSYLRTLVEENITI